MNSTLDNGTSPMGPSASPPAGASSTVSTLLANMTTGVLRLAAAPAAVAFSPATNVSSLYSNLDSSVTSLSEATPTPFATSASASSSGAYVFNCRDGIILPCWHSDGSLFTILHHGALYLIALLYMFVGVAIIADRFMASIEQITSQEQDVVVRRKDGTKEIISVRVWNETVSNLTLMALGSSAPEIMLSVIEVYAQDFQAGELGPGTIVGSAAFNMFIIIAVCVWAVPTGTLKKIKYLRVFIVTLTFSVFAYVWMLAILVWISPGVIEVWEGLVTFGFFFLTVALAYIADRRLLIYKYLDKHYRYKNKRFPLTNGGSATAGYDENDGTDAEKVELTNMTGKEGGKGAGEAKENGEVPPTTPPVELRDSVARNLKFIDASEEDLRTIEDQRDHVIEILKDVKLRYPQASAEEIEMLARSEIAKLEPKSRAYYRIIAAKRYFGSNSDIHGTPENRPFTGEGRGGDSYTTDSPLVERLVTVDILFDPAEYTVMENVGRVNLTLTRVGDLASTIIVDYETENGNAKAGSDYIAKADTVIFGPGEAHKQISIEIINDDEFEDDEHFYICLMEARYQSAAVDTASRPEIRIVTPKAKVNILDDDHSGIFGFINNVFQIPETIGEYRLTVNRYCGARGSVAVPYRTIPATAKPGEDFELTEGEVVFHNNETAKEITLQIINNINYEKNSIFYVELSEPRRVDEKMASYDRGAPRLGDLTKCMIRIRESKDFKQIVDNLMRRRKMGVGDRAGSWENQLMDAVRVHKRSGSSELSYDDVEGSPVKRSPKHHELGSEGPSSEGDGAESEKKSLLDYFFHYLTLFWKIIFAFVPPPSIWNGWACFVVSIIVIGILTSFINDLASHFGSTVHLKDSVTAISLVALGTSVPDTFASKIAAQNEQHADSSIGNVTGSNAVNVFLGIGLAWTVAAIYHAFKGTPGGFQVDPGSLAYSVTLFCICAFLCSVILMLRRSFLGGELGGSLIWKIITVACFAGLWIFYVTMSTLEAYGVVEAF